MVDCAPRPRRRRRRVAAIPVPVAEARAFGVLEVDDRRRGRRLRREAGARRARCPAGPAGRWRRWATTSSRQRPLVDELARDSVERVGARLRAQHPAGDGGARPRRLRLRLLAERDPRRASEHERGYWRDVGTIERLLAGEHGPRQGRARRSTSTTRAGRSAPGRARCRRRSSCSPIRRRPGTRASASPPTRSCPRAASSPAGASTAPSCRRGVRVNSFAHVEESILFDGVDIGRHARIRRAIIDKGVHIPPDTEIGYDPEDDRAPLHRLRRGHRRRARRRPTSERPTSGVRLRRRRDAPVALVHARPAAGRRAAPSPARAAG